ncbi:TetR/AcrR family transcriptional regulator [Geminicoccus flavidas]|uniref:TetR/AcrR family transcriptional regulator n=1 Tax=Geminicoccus flavidas TaxID=2506407 RepID=UPI00135BD5FC|nr:TetR/AcrR family transcriptional regulator [Geminicoccus flavidas]
MTNPDESCLKRRGRPRSFDRAAALEQAMLLFWRQGYAATSIADLTEAMGISPPSLYAAFGDKERLFLEALDRYQGDVLSSAALIMARAPSARAAVEAVLRATADRLTRPDLPRGCMAVTSAMNCGEELSHLAEELVRRRKASLQRLRDRLDRALADGELPDGTDTAALATFYQTVAQGMTIQARDGASRDELLATVEAAMRAWPGKNEAQHDPQPADATGQAGR